MRLIVYPYKMSSKSGRVLARSFDRGLRVYPDRNYRPRRGDFIVNWGSGALPVWWSRYCYLKEHGCEAELDMFNYPNRVQNAADKPTAYEIFQDADLNVPEWTYSMGDARAWAEDGHVVFCRALRRSGGGNGISIARNVEELACSRFFTKLVPITHEYRVHVWDGNEVIDVTEKRRMCGAQADLYIRNHDHGWVFCREDMVVPQAVMPSAVCAVEALGLDFGAVDVGYNADTGEATIFEVNTAPGLEGTTLERYVAAITQSMEDAQ